MHIETHLTGMSCCDYGRVELSYFLDKHNSQSSEIGLSQMNNQLQKSDESQNNAWSIQQDLLVIKLHTIYGSKWNRIAEAFSNNTQRSPQHICRRYQVCILQRYAFLLKRFNQNPVGLRDHIETELRRLEKGEWTETEQHLYTQILKNKQQVITSTVASDRQNYKNLGSAEKVKKSSDPKLQKPDSNGSRNQQTFKERIISLIYQSLSKVHESNRLSSQISYFKADTYNEVNIRQRPNNFYILFKLYKYDKSNVYQWYDLPLKVLNSIERNIKDAILVLNQLWPLIFDMELSAKRKSSKRRNASSSNLSSNSNSIIHEKLSEINFNRLYSYRDRERILSQLDSAHQQGGLEALQSRKEFKRMVFLIFKMMSSSCTLSSKILVRLFKSYRYEGFLEVYGEDLVVSVKAYIEKLYSESKFHKIDKSRKEIDGYNSQTKIPGKNSRGPRVDNDRNHARGVQLSHKIQRKGNQATAHFGSRPKHDQTGSKDESEGVKVYSSKIEEKLRRYKKMLESNKLISRLTTKGRTPANPKHPARDGEANIAELWREKSRSARGKQADLCAEPIELQSDSSGSDSSLEVPGIGQEGAQRERPARQGSHQEELSLNDQDLGIKICTDSEYDEL